MLRATSAWVARATTSVAVALLLPTLASLAAPTSTVSVITVPAATAAPTFTWSWKLPALPAATLGFVHETTPVAPTAGVVQLQPAGEASARKVVFPGMLSEKVAVVAAALPVLVTT